MRRLRNLLRLKPDKRLFNVVHLEGSVYDPLNPQRPINQLAVEYRGYWFYVADDDQTTKSTFMLLSQLFALQAGEISRTKPLLTLPVGG